ncbi:hypothetical protein GTY84_27750 [Streptomyces sp. SID8352]|nr:hypothetical protein [Streptomyces sp. SID8352]MYU25501.1 hypothetical protein [Streptomyces sp. SID8352]
MGRWCRGRWHAGAVARRAAAAALLVTAALLPGGTAVAAGTPGGYGFAPGARPVEGAAGAPDARPLEAGGTYRSSLPRHDTVYYRVGLDAGSTAYVSVTAVPGAGDEVTAADGLRVALRDADGGSCSLNTVIFGAARSARPLTAQVVREVRDRGKRCQAAGTYYLTVERTRPQDSPQGAWALELTVATEPGPAQAGPTGAPEDWDSATPAPPTGAPGRLRGADGFAGATLVGPGVWRDTVRPGQTLYYKVPVDWGRRPYASVDLEGATGGSGYTDGALRLALYTPVRGEVHGAARGYSGRRTTVGLAALPPAAHANRHSADSRVSGMRFAGDYYLVVHLSAKVADGFGDGPFGLTLRVRVDGTVRPGPGYDGTARPEGVFDVSTWNPAVAAATGGGGNGGGAARGDSATRALAVGGIGTGTALLLGLGVWTVVARRGAGASAQPRNRAQKPTA